MGTGKTSTICGLVSALLSGQAPLPKQRQHGCLIKTAIQKPGNTKVALEPTSRNRILVCAVTNHAADMLAWKINQTSLGTSGKIGDFAMARFGTLPWESKSSYSTNQRPTILSDMEEFLSKINVNSQVQDKIKEYETGIESEENRKLWSHEGNHRGKKRKKIPSRGTLRFEIISNSSVVIATLSGAGSKAFIDAAYRDPNKSNCEFDAVIIDEACQISEPESLIAFKFNPTTVTLVGDPKQLPALTVARNPCYKSLHERSLFERLQRLNFPTTLLRNQYRMHKSIAAFPSEQFYEGKLITSDSVTNRNLSPWYSCPCFPVACFWDVNGQQNSRSRHSGETNWLEANFITKKVLYTLAHTFLRQADEQITVGIISFYRDQVNLLNKQLSTIPVLNNSNLKVKVETVDGFQGSECDIIIVTCVRSLLHHAQGVRRGDWTTNSIGFLNDYRRVNVALTRAKRSLWIVGNAHVLKSCEVWRKLIQDFDHRKMLRRGHTFSQLFAQWSNQSKK